MRRFLAGFVMLMGLIGPLCAKEKVVQPVQQTLGIIKPDAVAANRIGRIVAHIEGANLRVVALRMTWMNPDMAALFYSAHKDRPFYQSLVDYMSSGPVVAMVLEGENAVEAYRKLMGATDPSKAAPNTLRKLFGTNVERNAVHGSDSVESAKKEIAFFFKENQIYSKVK